MNSFARHFLAQAVEHAALGDDDERCRRRSPAVADHFFGRADFVGEQAHGVGAFRVGDDLGVGILRADRCDASRG